MAYIGQYNTVMLDNDNFFSVPASVALAYLHPTRPMSPALRLTAKKSENNRKQKLFVAAPCFSFDRFFWLFADPEMRKRQADTAYFSPILLHGCPLRRKLPFSASSLRSDAEPKAGSRAVKGVSACRNVRFGRTDGDDQCPVQLQASAHQG